MVEVDLEDLWLIIVVEEPQESQDLLAPDMDDDDAGSADTKKSVNDVLGKNKTKYKSYFKIRTPAVESSWPFSYTISVSIFSTRRLLSKRWTPSIRELIL